MKTKIILALILILGSFLRLYQLSSLPISLFGDEVDVGYQAWSLWETGSDYRGNYLPTYIQSLSESRAPLLMYLTAPFVGLLGPSAFSVRLPVAIMGIASIYLLFLVSKLILKSNKSALLAALLIAITPWHIHYSRAAFEVVPLVFLLLLGTYFYLTHKFAPSLFFLVLTLFTYSTAVVYTPIFLISLIYFFGKPKISLNIKNTTLYFVSIILFLISLGNVFFGTASDRFQGLSLLGSFQVSEKVILSRNEVWIQNPFVEKLLVNKYTASIHAFISNYLSAFSPSFLFTSGDPFFRHSSGMSGELLWGVLPFFILGLFWCTQNIKDKSVQFLIFLLLFAPLPSALTTTGANHATRLFLMLPPLILISSLSVNYLQSRFKFIFLTTFILSIALLSSFVFYYYNYTVHYKYQSWQYWNYGFDLTFKKLGELDDQFSQVYINNTYQPSLLSFAFYTKENPAKFQESFTTDNQASYEDKEIAFTGFRYGDKYFFGGFNTIEDLEANIKKDNLYLVTQGKDVPGDWDWGKNPPHWAIVHHSVYTPIGTPLFYLVSGKK